MRSPTPNPTPDPTPSPTPDPTPTPPLYPPPYPPPYPHRLVNSVNSNLGRRSRGELCAIALTRSSSEPLCFGSGVGLALRGGTATEVLIK